MLLKSSVTTLCDVKRGCDSAPKPVTTAAVWYHLVFKIPIQTCWRSNKSISFPGKLTASVSAAGCKQRAKYDAFWRSCTAEQRCYQVFSWQVLTIQCRNTANICYLDLTGWLLIIWVLAMVMESLPFNQGVKQSGAHWFWDLTGTRHLLTTTPSETWRLPSHRVGLMWENEWATRLISPQSPSSAVSGADRWAKSA